MRVLSQEDVRQQSLPLREFVQAVGKEIDYYALREVFWQFGAGNFNDLPLVCVCSRDELGGALSGYIAEEDIVLLAEDFVCKGEESQIVAALVQEVITALTARAAHLETHSEAHSKLEYGHPLAPSPDELPARDHP